MGVQYVTCGWWERQGRGLERKVMSICAAEWHSCVFLYSDFGLFFQCGNVTPKLPFLVCGNQTDSNFEYVLREQVDLSDETHKPCNYSNYEAIPLQVRTHKQKH